MSTLSLPTQLQYLALTSYSRDEAMSLLVSAEALRNGYEAHHVPTPEWLTRAIETLTTQVEQKDAPA